MFQERLKMLREEAGMLQKEVAEKIGVSERVYSFYETGRFPKNEEIIKNLAACFGCTTDYLLGVSEFRNDDEAKQISENLKLFKQIKNLQVLEDIKEIFNTLADIGESAGGESLAVTHCLDNVVDSIHEIFSSYNSSIKETENAASKELQNLKHFEFKSYSFEKIDAINHSIKAMANALANHINHES